MALSGGIMDAVAGHDDPAQTPITASSFEPASIPNPRAWERVAVPPVGHARQRKIWKRVGGFPTNALPQSYLSAMAELESNGDVARKRARTARFVPIFGDAQWDPRHDQPRDGKSDLADARVSASAELENASPSEDGARFIPRKRHSSGWPIEPETGVAAPTEPVEQLDQTKIRRRSMRRFSRRISLSTIAEESPRQLEHISLSPVKRTPGPAVSPTKRAVITSSPTKVAESPRRLFMVDLPRSDLLLQSPNPTLATMSPAKSPPVSGSTPQKDTTDPSLTTDQETTTESSPLIFDQPIPTIKVEPQYETRRKISLLSAKRSDRRSSGFRTVDFSTAREAPKRRHSFNPAQSAPAEVTSRRTSLDFLSSMPDEAHPLTTVDEEGDSAEDRQELPAKPTKDLPVAYEVDVGTNLDIFGQIRHVPAVKTPKPASDLPSNSSDATISIEKGISSSPDNSTLCPSTPVEKTFHPSSPLPKTMSPSSPIEKNKSPASVEKTVSPSSPVDKIISPSSPVEKTLSPSSPVKSAIKTSSPVQNTGNSIHSSSPVANSITISSPVVQKEAVMEPVSDIDPDVTDNVTTGADEPDETGCVDLVNESSSSSEDGESPSAELDTPQSDLEFEAQEPEGLSTIYEESGIDATSPQPVGVDVNSTKTVAEVNDASILTAEDLSEIQVTRALDVPVDADETKEIPITSELVRCDGNLKQASSPANHVQDVAPTTPTGNAVSIPHSPEGVSNEASIQNSSELSLASLDQSTLSPHHLSADMEIDESGTTGIPVALATPSTPEKATVSESTQPTMVSQQGDTLGSPHSSESSGFTPINGRQTSPTSVTAKPIEVPNDTAGGFDAVVAKPDEDVIMTDADNIATEVDEEHPVNVTDLPKAENDTITLARHDDADFVRDFVSRVAAGKSAKAAAAAPVATEPPKKIGRPKRLSGSTASTTTSTGSPVPKSDSPKRTPLTEKSANSPSPLKKRKLEDDEEIAKPEGELEDGDDAPKIKRRRKRADPVVEETASSQPETEPEPDSGSGPRRSTRARTTRISLRSAGPSANSIARALYPLRRPGGLSGMIEDPDLDGQSNLSRQRSEAKSTEALTRSNTRANKSGAVLPHVLLARLAEDPTWKMKELKGVFDAKESRLAADGKSKKPKGVRWDPELVRYQDDNSSNKVFKTMAKSLLADIMNGDGVDEEDELALPTPTPTVQPAFDDENTPPAEKPLPAKKSAAPVRRTRSSRLQAPTPVKKLASGSGVGGSDSKSSNIISPPTVMGPVRVAKSTRAPKTTAKSIPTPTASTSTSSTGKASSSSSSARPGMATRRTKIASLGMGVNGTPAPKRRGRTTS